MRTAEKILQEVQARKAAIIADAEKAAKEWGNMLQRAQAEALTTADDPHKVNENIAARHQLQTATEKKAEAEAVLAEINGGRADIATDDETAEYMACLKKETLLELQKNCMRQLELRTELDKLQKQAYDLHNASVAAVDAWFRNLTARKDRRFDEIYFSSEVDATGMEGPYRSLAACYVLCGNPFIDVNPEMTATNNAAARIQERLAALK